MKHIETFRADTRISGIYLCKSKISSMTKNGKPYESIILQDKTGTIDAKIWDPNSQGIDEFKALDYMEVVADVINFNGTLQLSVKRVRKAEEGEYEPSDYLPVSNKDIEQMYEELLAYIDNIVNPYLKKLLYSFFLEDQEFIKNFKNHSAAKSVHHSFIGGLLQHTLAVTKLCAFYCEQYEKLNRDLLLTAAIFHDMGKINELSAFPVNDYTDDGQLLGHIVMGVEILGHKIREIEGFPPKLASELKHCILAHHGEYEYGSPKKPAIIEALALNFADNTDAKIQTMTEVLNGTNEEDGQEWLGYNRWFESNVRRTGK